MAQIEEEDITTTRYEAAPFDRGFVIAWVLMSVGGIVLGTTARHCHPRSSGVAGGS